MISRLRNEGKKRGAEVGTENEQGENEGTTESVDYSVLIVAVPERCMNV